MYVFVYVLALQFTVVLSNGKNDVCMYMYIYMCVCVCDLISYIHVSIALLCSAWAD